MSTSTLVLHKGAREVSREELERVTTPPATKTHYPVPFHRFLDMTLESLRGASFHPTKQRFALSRNDMRFFCVIDLDSPLAEGVTLACALSSAHDASLSYRFTAGNRTFCCDNLAMSSDLIGVVKRKHTRNGEARMMEAIAAATKLLPQFAEAESSRILTARRTVIDDTKAESLVVRAWERDIISHRYALPILREFRAPSFPEFEGDKTVYRLEQAFTTCLGPMARVSPQRYLRATLALRALVSEYALSA